MHRIHYHHVKLFLMLTQQHFRLDNNVIKSITHPTDLSALTMFNLFHRQCNITFYISLLAALTHFLGLLTPTSNLLAPLLTLGRCLSPDNESFDCRPNTKPIHFWHQSTAGPVLDTRDLNVHPVIQLNMPSKFE